jgi:hypothetical protein
MSPSYKTRHGEIIHWPEPAAMLPKPGPVQPDGRRINTAAFEARIKTTGAFLHGYMMDDDGVSGESHLKKACSTER